MAEKQATLEPQEMAARLRLCSFGRGLWLGQVLPFLAVAGVLSIIVEVWNRVAASKVPSKRPEEQVSPLRWFALGYLIVIVLQTKAKIPVANDSAPLFYCAQRMPSSKKMPTSGAGGNKVGYLSSQPSNSCCTAAKGRIHCAAVDFDAAQGPRCFPIW